MAIDEKKNSGATAPKNNRRNDNRKNKVLTQPNAKDNKKHYLSKKHACMVSNEELLANEELRNTIKYDYNTILVSMNATKIN